MNPTGETYPTIAKGNQRVHAALSFPAAGLTLPDQPLEFLLSARNDGARVAQALNGPSISDTRTGPSHKTAPGRFALSAGQ